MSEVDLRFPIGPSPVVALQTEGERARAIAAIASCPEEMRRAVAGLDDARLDTPYRDGGWTSRQVVHHVADSHMNAYIRHKLAVTEEHPTIKPYDEALWAETVDGRSGDPGVSLTLLAMVHDRWVRFLRSLPPEAFARTFVHPAIDGPVTLDGSVAMYAWHGAHHVAHVASLRRRRGW